MAVNWWVLFGVTVGGVLLSALILYFGWRGAMMGIAAFAASILIVEHTDLSLQARLPIFLIFAGAAYLAELRWRLKAFHRLADSLGASWERGGDSALGVIEGTFNGRKFKMDYEEKGEGRYAENWLRVTIACTATGSPSHYVLGAGSEGFVQDRSEQERFALAIEAAKQRLYGERRLLEPLAIRLLHAGKLAPGGYGILWSNAGHINFERLPAILKCLDATAGAVEKDRSGANQAPS